MVYCLGGSSIVNKYILFAGEFANQEYFKILYDNTIKCD